MVLYTITGLLLAWLAYMNKDHLPCVTILFSALTRMFPKPTFAP